MSLPESRYQARKYLERHNALVTRRTYYCRCRTSWGAGNMKTPHHVSVIDGVLEHRTVCTNEAHLLDIKQLFYRERYKEIEESQVLKERKKNAAYWKQMKAASQAKYVRYAKDKLMSYPRAEFEVGVFEALDKAEADAIWDEAALYIPKFTEQE